MRNLIQIILVFASLIYAMDEPNKLRKEIPINDVEKVEVYIRFGAGNLFINPTVKNVLFQGEFIYSDDEPYIRYDREGEEGRLRIEMRNKTEKENGDMNVTINSLSDIYKNEWLLNFNENTELAFKIEMGAAEAEIDFGAMRIANLRFESGASKTKVNFSQPNPVNMDELEIDTGVSRFKAKNLLNANFDEMKFEGGIGDYQLHFGGTLKKTVNVNLDVALGALTVYIPREVAFRIDCDKTIFSSLDIEAAYKEDDEKCWYSMNFSQSKPFLNLWIEAGIGSISIEIVEQ